ncbi:hypothetical protein H0H93_005573, partial [Arthromyces matolae]
LDDILAGKAANPAPLDKIATYSQRLDTTSTSSLAGHAFFNGKNVKYNDDDTPGSLRVYNLPTLFSRIGFQAAPATFFYPAESVVIPLSLYVVADLDSPEGLNLVKEALVSIGPDTRTRISFLHNPVIDPSEESKRPLTSWLLSHLIKSRLLSKGSRKQLLIALAVRVLTESVKVADFSAGACIEFAELLAREIGVKPGQQALLIKGRVVFPFEGPNAFQVADFIALEGYEARKRAEPVISPFEAISPSSIQDDSHAFRATFADLISITSSAVAAIQLPDPSDISLFQARDYSPGYTLAMDVSPAWLVRPREALYDPDNIQLDHLSPGDSSLEAIFDLDYLVDEGHAREIHSNSPPPGLHIELLRGGDEASPIDDTQVVANLGYFQFKATPGVLGLEIRKGRGRDVYEMESVGNEG